MNLNHSFLTQGVYSYFGALANQITAHFSGVTLNKLVASVQRVFTLLTSTDKFQLGALGGFIAPCLLDGIPSFKVLVGAVLILLVMAWRVRRWRTALLGFVLAFIFAVIQFDRFSQRSFPPVLESTSLSIEGVVIGLPQTKETKLQFDFRIKKIAYPSGDKITTVLDSQLQKLTGQRVRLSCYQCRIAIDADQSWRLTVRVKRPHGYASWGAFDYERYLFREQIIALGYVREKEPYQFLGTTHRSTHGWRSRIRVQFDELLKQHSPGAGIIAALTLGDKSRLSSTQKDIFQSVGVSHLMAISGLHVGLVFVATLLFLQYLLWPVVGLFNFVSRQTIVLIPGLLAATVYAALSGFAVSTQRALIMLALYVFCRLSARDLNLMRVLLLAAVLILFYDPFSILDAGFWLSCCAVFIIALLNLQQKKVTLWKLQPALWLGMIPVTGVLFGQVSLVSPMVNLVAVPVFCMVLIPLTLSALLLHQLGIESLALPAISWLENAYTWIYQLFEWCASLPLALFYPPALELWKWILLGGVIVVSLLKPKMIALVALLLVCCLWPSRNLMPPDAFTVTVLDVGQGLSIVVEATDYVLVYDTGPAYGTGFSAAKAVLLPYLRSRGIRQIDQLIISHADNDHIGGLNDVLTQMRVKSILTSRPDRIPGAQQCATGQTWQVQTIKFAVLGPNEATPKGSNNRSCVLTIENAHFRMLITGDIERQVERYMVQNPQISLQSNFLLVPHQGSKTSSTAEFLQAVQPTLAFLAAGYRNHYGHPHADVVDRYEKRNIELLSTISLGSIQLKVEAQDWKWTAFRTQSPRFWRK